MLSKGSTATTGVCDGASSAPIVRQAPIPSATRTSVAPKAAARLSRHAAGAARKGVGTGAGTRR